MDFNDVLYKCSRCNALVPGGLNGLGRHISRTHGVQLTQHGEFICGQEGCVLRNTFFKNLRRHITIAHGGLRPELLPEGVPVPVEPPDEVAGVEPAAAGGDPHADGVPFIPDPAHVIGADPPLAAPIPAVDRCVRGYDIDRNLNDAMEVDEDGDSEHENDLEFVCDIQPVSEDEDSSDDGGDDPDDDPDEDDPGQDDNEEILANDPRRFAARLLLDLQAKPNMTGTMVRLMIDRCEELVTAVASTLKGHVQDFLRARNIQPDDQTRQLLGRFDNIKPFHKMKSSHGQDTAFKKFFNYIKPRKVQLPGYRYEQRLTREGLYVQRPIRESFMYVSPLDSIQMMLNKPEVRELIAAEVPSADGIIAKDIDGRLCKDHEFLRRHPQCLRIQLYCDGLETCNSLGSRKTIHKLDGFYMRLMNLPQKFQSKLGCTHLVMLVNTQDIRRYGFRVVLQSLMTDLECLESEEGAEMIINGAVTRVHATITSFTGDSEAVHEVFGLLGSGANVFCRACLVTRPQLHAGTTFIGEKRTRANHAAQLAHVALNANAATLYGLREDSVLNGLRFFHTTENYSWDLMHDFLRGLADSFVKLVLKKYTKRIPDGPPPLLTVEVLNSRINSFVYGYVDRRNKPSSNFSYEKIHDKSHDLSQKASQMWCLARVFPFLVSDIVPEDDPYMEFYSLFLQVLTILFSPRLRIDHPAYLHDLLVDLDRIRLQIFPDVNPINKDHHKNHAFEAIIELGTLLCYDCLNYERFHSPIRVRAAVCRNFQHIALTASRTCQLYQCSVWSGSTPEVLKAISKKKKPLQVLAQSVQGYRLLADNGVQEHDLVTTVESLTLYGTEYRPKLFVIVESSIDDLPVFAIIEQLVVVQNVAYAVVSEWRTVTFNDSLHAYQVEDIGRKDNRLVQLETLTYHQPISIWRPFGSNLPFLSPRHIIF